jgi:hypothetical protein
MIPPLYAPILHGSVWLISPPKIFLLHGPPSALSNGCRGLFPRGYNGRSVKLTTHLHLLPTSRMVELYLHPCNTTGGNTALPSSGPTIPLLLRVHSFRKMFIAPLPSDGRLFWLHYLSHQLSCKNIKTHRKCVMKVLTGFM